MIIDIKYKSETFLPKEIDDYFGEIKNRIIRDRLEVDKIQCHLSSLRGVIIKWLSNNSKTKYNEVKL